MIRKPLSILIILCCLLSLAACGKAAAPAPAETTSVPAATPTPTEPEKSGYTPSPEAMEALDGKKVLFIGNSYTYWGKAVLNKPCSVMDQESRSNDKGLFYQLCKENGMDVEVTNWVFAGHNFTDIMSDECLIEDDDCRGKNHMAFLQDPYFDYVCMQPFFETEYAGDLVTHLTPAMEFFRAANPNVKFLLLVPHATFFRNFKWAGELQSAADAGITVVNWGGMLDDIVNKRVEVPGATQPYFFQTFVISKKENDGHHQNLLAGYLTVMMTYCAITGDSAVGQPYAFVDDPSIQPDFDMERFKAENYIYETYTNFVDVYHSEPDMLGLQTLADQYLKKYNEVN